MNRNDLKGTAPQPEPKVKAMDRGAELAIRATAFKAYIEVAEDEENLLDDAVHAYNTALDWEPSDPNKVSVELDRNRIRAWLEKGRPFEHDYLVAKLRRSLGEGE